MDTNTRKYPIGIQTFERIRKDGYIYIDKTDLIWKLAHEAPSGTGAGADFSAARGRGNAPGAPDPWKKLTLKGIGPERKTYTVYGKAGK